MALQSQVYPLELSRTSTQPRYEESLSHRWAADLLGNGQADAALVWAKAAGHETDDVGVALRREKRALALTVAIGDLAGAFPLARVMTELSQFADRALDAA